MKIVPRIVVLVVVLALSIMGVAVPASAAPNAQTTTPLGQHTVKQGEWLYCIARAYQVDPIAIEQANPTAFPRLPYGGMYGMYGMYGWQNYYSWRYYDPANYILPGTVLVIPQVAWYNIPAGQTCAPQFTLPAGWPPAPAPTPTPGPVPPTPVPGACRAYHVVRWGQTLSSIAWYYGDTIQAIMTANPSITNPNLIYAGTTLCIP